MPPILTDPNVLSAGAIIATQCFIWWRLERIGGRVDDVRDEVEKINSRVDKLEQWRAFRRGLESGQNAGADSAEPVPTGE